jgi:hypothetical protein
MPVCVSLDVSNPCKSAADVISAYKAIFKSDNGDMLILSDVNRHYACIKVTLELW